MTAQETFLRNNFKTTLTASPGVTDTTFNVGSTAGLTKPCYLVVDPDNPARIEYFEVDSAGDITATALTMSSITKRYKTGSAAASGITHDIGAKVWMVPQQFHFEDLNDRIDGVAAGGLTLVDAAGDLLYGSAADTLARLAIGAAYQMLAVNAGGTAPSWQPSPSSVLSVAGDLLYASSANVLARLAKGTAYQALTMNSGATAPQWAASIQSLMTAAGDIIQASGANTPARLGIGTARQQLAVNSGATALEYVASLQSLLTTTGDIVYASAANTPARLGAGTSGHVLTSGGAGVAPSWAAVASGSATFKGAQVNLGATPQSIANNTLTAVGFDEEKIDSDSFHDNVTQNTRLTIPTTGKYLVGGTVTFAGNATGIREVFIQLNGTIITSHEDHTLDAGIFTAHVQAIVNATAAQYVEIAVYQNSGGALDVVGDSQNEGATSAYITFLGA